MQAMRLVVFIVVLIFLPAINAFALSTEIPFTETSNQNNAVCWQCHDGKETIEVPDTGIYAESGALRSLTPITLDRYQSGVHAHMACTDCHEGISSAPPHQINKSQKIECADCHKKLLATAKQKGNLNNLMALETVAKNSNLYLQSFHARPNKDDNNFSNATCDECHDTHFFNFTRDKRDPDYTSWRLDSRNRCGKCHDYQIEKFVESVHGVELFEKGNANAPNCTSCHPDNMTESEHWANYKIQSIEICGACHLKQLKSYRQSYHGQAVKLGHLNAAKCYDCHDSHQTVRVKDSSASVHLSNRLKTCKKCHNGQDYSMVSQGFLTFNPHAHTEDYARYPKMWLAARFMHGLIFSVCLFFALHSLLWFYRERQKTGQPQWNEVQTELERLQIPPTQPILRFKLGWRLGHLIFALSVMILILTGMTLKYAETNWAPVVVEWLGGVVSMGIVHRIAAGFMVGVFCLHLLFLVSRLWGDRHFSWFGPDSLLPNRQDFIDCITMFQWFVGRGAKPRFDRWTYYEKFDYWALFWGMTIIGGSGLILAFPERVGHNFQGWIFNVALFVHGEEALLATLFLFTIHFFNNHFRPNKWPPPDITMFTGSQTIAELHQEHPAQLQRLLASNQLDKALVAASPSAMIWSSKLLGLVLIVVGLLLLGLTLNGLFVV